MAEAVLVDVVVAVLCCEEDEACCDGWLNGTPGDEMIPAVAVSLDGLLVEEVSGEPLLSIILVVTVGSGAEALFEAKVMVAIGPLPEKAWVLTMAILMKPGREVFAASIAPATSPPWVTVGVASEAWS